MFYEFVATIVAGFGVAGLVILANRLLRGRLPRWLMPVAAGLAMIAFTIWAEYNWLDRVRAGLPEGVTIVAESRERMAYRPWTYLWPLTLRAVAVDTRRLRKNPAQPDLRMVPVVALGRWKAGIEINSVVDCAAGQRADMVEGVSIAEDGSLTGATWYALPEGDRLLRAVCGEG
ncbi:MAG: hypothetical protein H5U20_04605 [Rhodobacteraceae bacterium]|nr:hypothetical protein [Paracoccaceae bacterium]